MMSQTGAICGGGHLAREWTSEEINKHLTNPCIDCWCGIPFKEKEVVK